MRRKLISVVLSAMVLMPISAQTVNTDSIKAQMDKIEITNQGMKQVIENYKKGVIKGDLESKTLLGLECISGKYVKPDAAMGLVLLEEAANMATGYYAVEMEDINGESATISVNFEGDVFEFEESLERFAESENLDPETTKINNLEWDREDCRVSPLNYMVD